jgi:hypothetical protein
VEIELMAGTGITAGRVLAGTPATMDDGTTAYLVQTASPSDVAGTGTAKGGTITTGGTAQSLAAANPARRSFQLQNRSSGDLWINEAGGTAAIGDNASYQVTAGGTFTASTNQALSIIGATTGQAFTATETA